MYFTLEGFDTFTKTDRLFIIIIYIFMIVNHIKNKIFYKIAKCTNCDSETKCLLILSNTVCVWPIESNQIPTSGLWFIQIPWAFDSKKLPCIIMTA